MTSPGNEFLSHVKLRSPVLKRRATAADDAPADRVQLRHLAIRQPPAKRSSDLANLLRGLGPWDGQCALADGPASEERQERTAVCLKKDRGSPDAALDQQFAPQLQQSLRPSCSPQLTN